MAKGRIAVFCLKCKGRTLPVRPFYDSMGLVTLTSWGCYSLLYSLRKPNLAQAERSGASPPSLQSNNDQPGFSIYP
jgi:hypothetical protein